MPGFFSNGYTDSDPFGGADMGRSPDVGAILSRMQGAPRGNAYGPPASAAPGASNSFMPGEWDWLSKIGKRSKPGQGNVIWQQPKNKQQGLLTRLYQWLTSGGESGGPGIDQEISQWSKYGEGQPTDLGTFGPAASPQQPPQQMAPPYVPSTKLSSADAIAQRINKALGLPQEPEPVSSADFPQMRLSPSTRSLPPFEIPGLTGMSGGEPYMSATGGAVPGYALGGNVASLLGGNATGALFDLLGLGGGEEGRAENAIGPGIGLAGGQGAGQAFDILKHILPSLHAEGGQPDQRGGYPELYTAPIRKGYFATGGGSNYVSPDGRGDGRSDHVEARLSPGEYVMTAEDVANLGNGDNEAGARKLDKFRTNLRKHKGKALAKGKFSPDAKAPETYLRGA